MSERLSLAGLRAKARTLTYGGEPEKITAHDRFMARWVGPPVAWLMLKLGFSADGVTLLSVITGVVGAGLLSAGTLPLDIAAVVLINLSYFLDCADGVVSRVRGTSSLDGFMRDTFRHYLQNPAMFCGLTIGVYHRHPELYVVVAGLLGTVLSTRIVGDLEDRVSLAGLIKRLKQGPSADAAEMGPICPISPGSLSARALNFLRAKFLPDVAVMTWLTLAVIADAAWFRRLPEPWPLFLPQNGPPWLAMDAMLFLLAGAQAILKSGGLILLWRRGVSARVETIAAEIEDARKENDQIPSANEQAMTKAQGPMTRQ